MPSNDVLARLAVQVAMDSRDFATGATDVQKTLGRLQSSFQAFGDKWVQTGKRLSIGISAPLAAFGIASAKVASDAQELDSAFTQTFDHLSGAMRAWAVETGNSLGRSTQAMQEMANTFGIFFNQAAPTREAAAEMAKAFTVLAQDLSSFYNISGDEALQKLRSGLSGESEPLRDFGVFLTEANVKAKALQLGLTGLGDELTEQEKIMARYALILEGTTDAQGDVVRTSGGAANQWRSFTEAIKELQVAIGERLLPLLTPLIERMTSLVNGFNNLPGGVQTAIIAFGGLVAAIGPMMLIMATLVATVLPLFAARFGPIGIAISAFVNPLGTAISFLVQFAARLAGLSILNTIGGLLLRFAGPIGLVASLGLLIYKNWDRISQVFAEFRSRAQEALGPPLQNLIAVISGLLGALWAGPLGDGIRGAMAFMEQFGSAVVSILGEVLIGALKIALEVVIYVFEQIGTVIEVVTALLKGDFSGAWDAAKGFVTNAVTAMLSILATLAPGAIDMVRELYIGVKAWLQDKLGAVFDWVKDKVEAVKGYFFDLYDAVVGHSYIPDMVDEIGQNMARLQNLMVDPAQQATQNAGDAFRALAGDVSALLDRLFPQFARLKAMKDDLATIDKGESAGLLSPEVAQEARFRASGGGREQTVSDGVLNAPSLIAGMRDIGEVAKDLADQTKTQTVRIAESFKDMADKTLASFKGLIDSIRGGGFLDILGAAVGLFVQLGSIGAFGKTIAGNINKTPGYASGTSFHPGGLAVVGERGPELVSMPRGSRVYSNADSKAMAGGGRLQVEVVANNNGFGAIVRNHAGQVVAEAAPALMDGSARVAQSRIAYRQTRRVA